jgi:hypothetical protein
MNHQSFSQPLPCTPQKISYENLSNFFTPNSQQSSPSTSSSVHELIEQLTSNAREISKMTNSNLPISKSNSNSTSDSIIIENKIVELPSIGVEFNVTENLLLVDLATRSAYKKKKEM